MPWALIAVLLLCCSPTNEAPKSRSYPVTARIVKIEKTEASRTQDRLPCRSTIAGDGQPCFGGFEIKYLLAGADSLRDVPAAIADSITDSLLLYDLHGYAYPDTYYIRDNAISVGAELAGTLYVALEPDTSWRISFPEVKESDHIWAPCIPGGRCVNEILFTATITSIQKTDSSAHHLFMPGYENICYDGYEVKFAVTDSISGVVTNTMVLSIQTDHPNMADGSTRVCPGPLFIEKYKLYVGRVLTGKFLVDFWFHDGEVTFDSVDLHDGFENELCRP